VERGSGRAHDIDGDDWSAVNTESSGPMPIEVWKLAAALVSVMISGLFYSILLLMAPAFEQLYAGFGADLPAITTILFSVYPLFGLLVLIGLVPCIMLLMDRSRPDADRLMTVIVTSFGLSFVLFAAFMVAMYYPVFKVGAVL